MVHVIFARYHFKLDKPNNPSSAWSKLVWYKDKVNHNLHKCLFEHAAKKSNMSVSLINASSQIKLSPALNMFIYINESFFKRVIWAIDTGKVDFKI